MNTHKELKDYKKAERRRAKLHAGRAESPKLDPLAEELRKILEIDSPFWTQRMQKLYDLIAARDEHIKAGLLAAVGVTEPEFSNLNGDAGYWGVHGRNELRAELRAKIDQVFNQGGNDE